MKILKLLNKKFLFIFLSYLIILNPIHAEDNPIDIWKLEKKENETVEEVVIIESENNNDQISVSNIFRIVVFKFFSISLSTSTKFNLNFFATKEPIELLPDPIIPRKTRFFFDFISLNIEKTQICLNLKLTKVICNSTKIQVRAKKV